MAVFEMMAVLGLDKSGYDSGLDDAQSKASSIGGTIKSGFGTIAKAGAVALTAATGAAVAFGKSAVGAGMSFDSAMSQVAATMGTTTDQIGDLRDFAKEMGASTMFSATEAAQALNYMALAGYDSAQSMEMLPTVLNLAAAGGMDLATASDMVTDAQTALGLSFEETQTMVDQMARASSKTNTSVAQLGDALLTVGANARTMKNGTEEMASVLGVLADNGIKGSEAGTHLRNIILKMNPDTEKAQLAWKRLGVSTYDAQGNMRDLRDVFGDLSVAMEGMTDQEKQQLLSDMFNKTDLASVNALLGTTGDRWEELSYQLENASGSMVDVNESLRASGVEWEKYLDQAWMRDGLEDGIAGLTRQIKFNLDEQKLSVEETAEFISSEYDMSMEDAMAAVSSVSEALNGMGGAAEAMATEQMNNLSGSMKYFESAMEGVQILVSEQLTPTLKEFVDLGTTGLSAIVAGFNENGLQGVMDALGQTMADGITMISEMLPKAVEAGAGVLTALVKGISENVPELAKAATEVMTSFVKMLIEVVPELLKGAASMVSELAKGIGKSLPTLVPAATEAVLSFTENLIDNVDGIIDGAIALIEGLAVGIIDSIPILIERAPIIVEKLVDAILRNIPKIVEAGKKLLSSLVDDLPTIINNVLDALGKIIITVINGIVEAVPQILEAGAEFMGGLVTAISDSITGILAKVEEVIGSILQAVVDAIPRLVSAGLDFFISIVGDIDRAINEILPKVADFISGIVRKVADGARDMATAGKEFLNGIIPGFGDAVGAVYEKIREIAGNIIDAIKNVFGMNGGQNAFFSIGKDIMWGIVGGLNDMIGHVTETVSNMASGIVGTLKNVLGIASPSKVARFDVSHNFGYGIIEGLEDMFPDITDTVNDMSNLLIPETSAGAQPQVWSAGGGDSGTTINEYTQILELNGHEFGRLVFEAYNEEAARVGVSIVRG